MRVTFPKGTHYGYQFDPDGNVTAVKPYTLSRASGANVGDPQPIPNRDGLWLLVANGIWAGYYVHQTGAASDPEAEILHQVTEPPPPPPTDGNPQPPAGAVKLYGFSGTTLDTDWGWDMAMVGTSDNMNRFAMYRADPALLEVSNGTLKLKGRRNADGTWDQSYISTRGRYTRQYGIFRASMKLPAGHALWPSFWMLDVTSGAWHEVDVIEAYPEPVNPNWTLCIHTPSGAPCKGMALPADYATAFHVYETEWRASGTGDLFIARLDGAEVGRITVPLHVNPQILLLQMAIGVWFKNMGPDATTPTHPQLEVDWVGVWP